MRYNRFHRATNFLTPTLYTQELSDYVVNLKYEELPAEVVDRAKKILLHTMGAALAAANTPTAQKAVKMATEANGGVGGGTTLWSDGRKLAAANAALALGTMADALDWEDCSWTGHPAAGVIPCAWLAAEEKHKSGKDLIRAIVAGYEVYQRIAMAVQPSDERWEKGWGLTSWQIFAAILPVAVLYDFDSRKINQSIGVGCESSTIPACYHATTLSDFYHFEHGYRARDGFMTAKVVEKGIHNQRDALDESRCYRGVICGEDAKNGDGDEIVSGDESDPTWFTRDLGSRYLIMETMLKHWPANMWAQTAAEAAKRIRDRKSFSVEDIAEIIVDPPVAERMSVPAEGYSSVTHAQFSIPFVVASVLLGEEPGAGWYTDEKLTDPAIMAIAAKVHAGDKPEETALSGFKAFQQDSFLPETVTVVLKDGTCLSETVQFLPGHPQNVLSWEELTATFRRQAAEALTAEQIEKVIAAVAEIEKTDDMAVLSESLFVR